MMNGAVDFRLTKDGWRVAHVWNFGNQPVDTNVKHIKPFCCLMVTGRFSKPVRPGQFCKRPHKLLESNHA